MPEYLHPGVYIEEIERGPRPVEGVPTSTAAFLGEAERGSITPRLVTSYKDYQRWFGDVYDADKFLPYTVSGFFENGGKRMFICRVVGEGAATALMDFGDFQVRAAGPGAWGNRVFASISDSTTKKADGNSVGFRLVLAYWSGDGVAFDPLAPENQQRVPRPVLIEDFDDLVVNEVSPDFYGKRLPFIDSDKGDANQGSESSALGMLVRKSGVAAGARPANGAQTLAGGADDTNVLGPNDYTGLPAGNRTAAQGLFALQFDPYRDVALVYAPSVSNDIVLKIIGHCEEMRFRFAVVDCDKGASSTADLDPRTKLPTDSSYAAYYYPWIMTSDPRTGARKLIPPGGHVLGIYGRTDTERGVFKSPANEIVRGALDLEFDINDNAQDDLNPKGVNVIRRFPGRGIRVWGARTVTSDALWKYVSVRRLFIFLERSIYEGTQWVVFEPNDDRLWARVVDTIRLFLRGQWRLGALLGRTEQEAFFITCDRSTMSQDDILNGRLICEVGIAPVRPAEFVIFRIFQNTAEAQR
ncbi:phage tail sheath family protein [Paraburkholderia terrae]|uniref:phage tail sheath family protein n=1 Tax=Paraburkholderia terrae TaxID=311230 RepID=UPI00296AF23D|nr:phage tail sheath family protein [Paraburkholderia terrae]MDW3660595.1 phage tail sheath family protein [Paraburkholderia terrae]